MKLQQIKSLTKKQVDRLKADNWTVELVAKSDVFVLETYLRVSRPKAREIISEAQALLPQAPEATLTVTDSEGNTEVKKMSVKVKRIHDGMNE